MAVIMMAAVLYVVGAADPLDQHRVDAAQSTCAPPVPDACLITTATVSTAKVKVNGLVTYAVTAENVGNRPARHTSLVAALPDGTVYAPRRNDGVYDPATRTLRQEVGLLPPGESHTLSYEVRIAPASAATTIATRATAEYDDGAVSTSNEVNTTVDPAADLTLDVTTDPGEVTRYTIATTNEGPSPAAATHVIAALPDGTTAVTASSPDGTCAVTATTAECDYPDLPSGEARSMTVVAVTAPGETPTAPITVTATSPTGDPTPANNTIDVAPTPTKPAADSPSTEPTAGAAATPEPAADVSTAPEPTVDATNAPEPTTGATAASEPTVDAMTTTEPTAGAAIEPTASATATAGPTAAPEPTADAGTEPTSGATTGPSAGSEEAPVDTAASIDAAPASEPAPATAEAPVVLPGPSGTPRAEGPGARQGVAQRDLAAQQAPAPVIIPTTTPLPATAVPVPGVAPQLSAPGTPLPSVPNPTPTVITPPPATVPAREQYWADPLPDPVPFSGSPLATATILGLALLAGGLIVLASLRGRWWPRRTTKS
ncbi:hypothetical protein AB0J83_09085 [Actinoplanes sp. NPDC049596]|uniref:hypothetical protein n=1 Tax=unclassified Actinoplanes TaxID=2626549 RepID=UPI0034174431